METLGESKRKPKTMETYDEKEFVHQILEGFSSKQGLKRYSRHTAKGAVFADRFNRTSRDKFRK